MRAIRVIAFLAVACISARAADQFARYNGNCEQGGTVVKTNGVASQQKVMGSYPACTVTVYLHGSLVLANLFQDSAGTIPLANPFTSDSHGVAAWYATDGRYDVQYSNAGILTPFAVADIILCFSCSGGGGGGGLTGVAPGQGLIQISTTVGIAPCPFGQVQQSTGTGWTCAVAATPPTFQTNGTNNGSQTLLNLQAGSNMTLTDNGLGTVTLASTGGGGGGTPGNPSGSVQFNDAGSFAGAGALLYNKTLAETTANNFNRIRYVTPAWNWLQTPGGTLTGGSPATVTLTPCPLGIDVTNNANAQYSVYLSAGTGTAEPVSVTGGSCTSGAASGTITFTPANSHSGAWAVGSASSGIQEAINDCAVARCRIVLLPAGDRTAQVEYDVYATVYFTLNRSELDGTSALIYCFTRSRCLNMGDLAGNFGDIIMKGVQIASFVDIDGVLISSVKATSGRYTVTTTAAHPFVNNDWVIFYYSTVTQGQEARVQVNTGSNCVNGSGGAGACLTTEFEYVIGSTTFTSSAGYGWAALENAAIEDTGNNLIIRDLLFFGTVGGQGQFNQGIVIGNDQNMTINHATISRIKCDTLNFCGNAIYGRGDQGATPVGHFSNMQLSMQCRGNGIRWVGANGLGVDHAIVQGMRQYGLHYGEGLQPWSTNDMYEEVGGCPNFAYPGTTNVVAGYVVGSSGTITTNTAVAGAFPVFPAQNAGAQQNNYYIVIKANGVNAGMYYIGSGTTSGSGTMTVTWPEPKLETAASPVTYDLLKTIGTAVTSMPYIGNANSVATGITRASACTTSNGFCTFTDTQISTTPYTFTQQTANPVSLEFWPGSVILSHGSQLQTTNCNGPGIVTTTYLPSVVCSGQGVAGGSVGAKSPAFQQILGGNGTVGANAFLNFQGNASGGGNGLKGLWNVINFQNVPQGDVFTLSNAVNEKVLASSNYRPLADIGDTAIGFDNVPNAPLANASLAFRTPANMSFYTNALFDGTSWDERLTGTQAIFNVPILSQSQIIALGQGCFGCGPFSLSGTQVSGFTGANFTNLNISQPIVFNGTTAVGPGGANFGQATYTAASFTGGQYIQARVNSLVGGGQVRICTNQSTVAGTFTAYCYGSTAIYKMAASPIGSASVLLGSLPAFANGDVLYFASTTTGTTTTLYAYQNGINVGQITDSTTPYTTGSPGIFESASAVLDTFRAGNLAYSSPADMTETGNHVVNNLTVTGTCTGCGGGGGGGITSIATTAPISGGPISPPNGTISCPTCVVASSPGVGVAHFAGSTQTVTSSGIVDADMGGAIGVSHGGTGAGTAAGALINLLPAATRVGDLLYCGTFSSGCTSWTLLPGNNGGATQWLQETTGGVPSWTIPPGSGTVAVVGAGSLTSTALVTGGGTQLIQTPSATSTLSSAGVLSLAAGGSIGSADTGTPKFTFGTNLITANQNVVAPIHAATTGFSISGATTSGHYLRNNGTNYVDSALLAGDIPSLSGTYCALTGCTMTGNELFSVDNTWNIGAVSTTRPANVYAGTSVNAPTINALTGFQIGGIAPAGHFLTGTVGGFYADNSLLQDNGTTLTYNGGGGISAQSLSISTPFQVYSTIPASPFTAVTGTSGIGVSNDGNYYISANGGTPAQILTSASANLFSTIGSGTNTTATMVCGTGCSLGPTDSTHGVVSANNLVFTGATIPMGAAPTTNQVLVYNGTSIVGTTGTQSWPAGGAGIMVYNGASNFGTTLLSSGTGIPQTTGTGFTLGTVPNALLANSLTTVNGQNCSLGGTCAVESATSGQVAISGGAGSPLTGASDLTYLTHTFSTATTGIFDLSASQQTNGLIVPSNASNTASVAGALTYDTTSSNYHANNGADDVIAVVPTASIPGNGIILSSVFSGGKFSIGASAIQQGNVVTATAAAGAANQVAISAGATKALTYATLDNTTTHALFATAGAPAFRALAVGDLPAALGSSTTAHNVEAPLLCADTSASGSAQVCTTSPSFTPASADCILYTTTTANTGTALTINVNSLGAKSVAKFQTTTTLAANDIRANTQNVLCYDGTNWEINGQLGNAPSGSGTVNSGTANHLAFYASSTTAVSDMGADFTFNTHTLTGGASSILDLTAATASNVKLPASMSFTTPNIGAATGTSLLVTGNVDGTAPVTVTTGSSASLGGTFNTGYTFNENATAGTAVAYTLPTAAAGKQYCVGNAYNGSNPNTGVLTVNASAAGQFIIFTDGSISATGGNVTSGGAGGDAACFVGVDGTHWQMYVNRGTWTKH